LLFVLGLKTFAKAKARAKKKVAYASQLKKSVKVKKFKNQN
jgi:hypothetical protein